MPNRIESIKELIMNSLNPNFRSRLMVGVCAAFLGLMAVNVPAQASELKQTMREMKSAMKGAMKSSTIDEFAKYAAQLQTSSNHAGSLNFSDNPGVYRQGMDELRQEIVRMNEAIKANDLATAKEALRKIDSTRKHYHKELG